MILIDANLLIYAYDPAAGNHHRARAWLESVLSTEREVGLPLQSVSAFLRILTQVGLPGARLSMAEAIDIVDTWFHLPSVRLLSPCETHWELLREILIESEANGRFVTDAQLAALVLEFDGTLYTTDSDFSRFPGLRWQNPLVP
ncbi:TA system VapC family ribonuclease toxin [Granulicella sp. dw_53]|uniref:TA system VapC family ribonuclease toxin n=1 Tax=Granulicella sp. dw_53 TaxID=2719792 RepID=UPI001BD26F4A